MAKLHTLIVGGGPMAHDIEAFLDGMPLKGVTSLSVSMNYGDVVRVTLEMIVEFGPSQLTADAALKVPLNIEELPPHIQQIATDLTALMEKQQKEAP